METTLDASSWNALCAEQHRRAMLGDKDALKWCAEHAPAAPIARTGWPDLSKLSVEQLKALVGDLASYTDAELMAEVKRRRLTV